MTHIISIVCHKGGVGKTTTAASLGGLLSAQGENVLLVDLDPQMNLTRTFTDGGYDDTVADAILRRKRLPVYAIRERLDIVPASGNLCSLDMTLAGALRREYILRRLLDEVSGRYDWILLDCPAQMSIVTTNALVACDRAIIPMSCDAYSGDGLRQILDFIEMAREANETLSVCGIVITRFQGRRLVDRTVSSLLDGAWSDLVFATRIRENAAIVQAPLAHTDVWSYDPRSNGAADYAALLEEIRGRLDGKKTKKK